MRQMEEERQKKKTEEAKKRSEEEEEQDSDAAPPPKKKKRDKKTVKTMTKEERQKHSEECKEERKAKALRQKKQEKAQLKREAHKEVLKKAKELLSRTEATSTVVRAEDLPSPVETFPEPSTSQQTDPLETSLVESGPQLLSLDPFEEEEEEMICPTSTGAARVISQTISVESNITKPQKIIGGKEPRSTGPKPAAKSDGLKSAGLKPAGSGPPRPTVGGKAPRKQAVPQKRKSRPGSGSLNYVPTT